MTETELVECWCGERHAIPWGWDAFVCSRCQRIWRRTVPDGWMLDA